MSLPPGNLQRTVPHPNTQPTPLSIDHANLQQLRALPQSMPLQPADPSVSGFPPPHPLQLPQQLQVSPQRLPPRLNWFSWTSLQTIQQTLMPHDSQCLTELMRAIDRTPDPFMTLTYQDLTLEHYLRDPSARTPPNYLLVDMMSKVGPAPKAGTQSKHFIAPGTSYNAVTQSP